MKCSRCGETYPALADLEAHCPAMADDDGAEYIFPCPYCEELTCRHCFGEAHVEIDAGEDSFYSPSYTEIRLCEKVS